MPAPAASALTAADVEAFLDGLVPLQIKQRDIAGVVVVVVQNGQVLFARGYGYADAKKKTPISPETTLFRPGSVSKLFTWTAVMQLVEQGKLDLDRDVNDYLDFQIPPAFGKPIMLRNIMTHTPGFEDVLKDLFCDDPGRIPSLRSYVTSRIPQRIYAPGATVAYSNYATTLAGYIVERVSGQPFSDYVTEKIFKPLGMNNSTFVRALAVLGSVNITSRDDRVLEISALKDLNGQIKRWQPIAPLMYRDVNGQDVLAFRRDASGRLEALLSALPVFVFQRVPWFQDRRLLLFLFGFAMAVFALTLVFWGIGAWLRRYYQHKLVLTRQERYVRIAARLACAIILLFVLGFVLLFQAAQKNIGMFNSSLDPLLRLLQVVSWIGAVGMLVILYDAYLAWSGACGWVAKVSSTLLVFACVAWIWFALVSNALSLNLRY